MIARHTAALIVMVLVFAPRVAQAQDNYASIKDDITVNGDAVTLTRILGMVTAKVQVTGTYDTTWEAQCSTDGVTFDTDDELLMVKVGDTSPVSEVSGDEESIWDINNIAGCDSIRVIATAYASGTQTVLIRATSTGGGGASTSGTSAFVDQSNDAITDDDNDSIRASIVSGGTVQVTTGSSGGSTATLGGCIWDDAVLTDTVTDGQNARKRCGPYGDWVAATIIDSTTGLPADLTAEPCSVRANISQVEISTNTTANNLLVTAGASQIVYPCGYDIVATGTVAVQFIQGTGTNCGTDEADITGAYPLVANSGFVRDLPKWKTTTAGNDLCLELSSGVQVDGVLEYELVTP